MKLTTILAVGLTLTTPAVVFAQQGPDKTPAPKKTEAKKDLPKKQAPKETLDQRIKRLVVQLGHAKYDVREDAFTKLLRIGRPALPALRRAAQSSDPEVASAAAEAVELINKGKRAPNSATPNQRGPKAPQFRGRRGQQPVPVPSREELMKELRKAMPKEFGKAFQRFFKDATPGQDQERSGKFHNRVRVWSWTNVPRRPQLSGLAGRLGLKTGPTSGVLRAQLSIRKGEGLVVNQLIKAGFGAANGIQIYDVLLTLDGRPIRTRTDMLTLANKGGTVEVYRKARLIRLKLPAAPAAKPATATKSKPASSSKKKKSQERDF